MKIKDFIGANIRYESNKIAADLELSQELQALLNELPRRKRTGYQN
jgi:hypothetical protein